MVALSEKKYNNCIIESILCNSWGCKNTRFAPTAKPQETNKVIKESRKNKKQKLEISENHKERYETCFFLWEETK